MTQQLPIQRLINTTVVLGAAPAQMQNISTLMILGTSSVITPTEGYRTYSSISQVAADFGSALPEYLAALLYFEQSPQPSELQIGRWVNANSSARLVGATLSASQQAYFIGNASVATANFGLAQNGGAVVNVSMAGTPFGAVTNMNGAASVIQAALLTGFPTNTPLIVWDAVYSRFELTAGTAGATSTLTFATTFVSGAMVDISAAAGLASTSSGAFLSQGQAASTAVATVAAFDAQYGQNWYGLQVPGAANADHLAVAAFIEATTSKHLYFVTTQEAAVLVPNATTDIAYQLKALGYLRTSVQFSSSNPYAAASYAARALTVDYRANKSAIALMYKQEPGIVAETLNTSQIASANDKNCNVFVAYNNGTAIIEQGKQASGDFTDIITGNDWLALDIQTEVYNLLYTSPTKIPQTDAGNQAIMTVMAGVLDQAVSNGVLAPGTWQQTGFGSLNQNDFMSKGYYIYAPPIANQSPTDRAARRSVSFQIAAKLAGAIQTVAIAIYVNR